MCLACLYTQARGRLNAACLTQSKRSGGLHAARISQLQGGFSLANVTAKKLAEIQHLGAAGPAGRCVVDQAVNLLRLCTLGECALVLPLSQQHAEWRSILHRQDSEQQEMGSQLQELCRGAEAAGSAPHMAA